MIRAGLRFWTLGFWFRYVSAVFRDVGVLSLCTRSNLKKRGRGGLLGIDSHRTWLGCGACGTGPTDITQTLSVETYAVSTALMLTLATSLTSSTVPSLLTVALAVMTQTISSTLSSVFSSWTRICGFTCRSGIRRSAKATSQVANAICSTARQIVGTTRGTRCDRFAGLTFVSNVTDTLSQTTYTSLVTVIFAESRVHRCTVGSGTSSFAVAFSTNTNTGFAAISGARYGFRAVIRGKACKAKTSTGMAVTISGTLVQTLTL